MKYIVTGTGRSGTGFMSKLMNHNDISFGHEIVFDTSCNLEYYKDNIKTTGLDGDSSWLIVPFLFDIISENPNIKVIQIIRNPLMVIKSFMELRTFSDDNVYSKLVSSNINGFNSLSELDRHISYCLKWFEIIENINCNKLQLNLENIDYNSLSDFVGINIEPLDDIVNRKTNEKVKKISITKLKKEIETSSLSNKFNLLMDKYGYTQNQL